MADQFLVTCPGCEQQFPLDATLAQPLLAEARAKAAQEVQAAKLAGEAAAAKAAAELAVVAQKEAELAAREAARAADVEAQIKQQREQIEAETSAKAAAQIAESQRAADKQLQDMQSQVLAAQRTAEEVKAKEEALLAKQADLDKVVAARVAADLQVQLETERSAIAAAEAKKAAEKLAESREADNKKLQEMAEQVEAANRERQALKVREDALVAEKLSMAKEVAAQVAAAKGEIAEQAEEDAAEKMRLKLAERDKVIERLLKDAEEMKRKGTITSQQLQGDVLEEDFEQTLKGAFPKDQITAVKAGARGGDIVQNVFGPNGRQVGTIFWEVKRTTTWGSDWIAKARHDAANSLADVAIIFSEIVPKGIDCFGECEGVWIVQPKYAVQFANIVRRSLDLEAAARLQATGKAAKAERLYEYMMGVEFRTAVEGIARPFVEMRGELEKEKRATMSRWKRQEKRIERVLGSVAGMQGSLQAIGGMEMLELPGFDEEVEEIGLEGID